MLPASRASVWSDAAAQSAVEAKAVAREAKEASWDVTSRLEKLTLLCRAMWTLLQERTGVTEEDLARRATEIDLLDGKADGKVSVRASMCTSCNRTVAPRHLKCIYCGTEKLVDTLFETV